MNNSKYSLKAFGFITASKWLFLPFVLSLHTASAQYFGQNKVKYGAFDFDVTQSPHFELYDYFDQPDISRRILQNSEHWYALHQEIFRDSFDTPNPLIFYRNHPEFQQTTVISGFIGEGTGGVTEGLKNRVVMPAMFSHRQTDHVLGHELVHAFQYHTLITGDSTSLNSISNLPLWMVEGLAEYLSIGRQDPHTAMWMRDALLHEDFPSIKDLNNPKYFPYRYGQAFWAFVTGIWGDRIIQPLFQQTALVGLDQALKNVIGFDAKTISNMWKSAVETAYKPLFREEMKQATGKLIASPLNAGEMNLSPAISPDGKYLAFLSEKDVLSIDLYISDTRMGKIIQKLKGNPLSDHIEGYSFIESSGTWSPDSRYFAMVTVSKGKNKLLIFDVLKNKQVRLAGLPGVPAFSNPAWSPDGKHIVVSGLVNGVSDLYLYEVKSGKVQNLTSDVYSDLQPSWSSDGKYLVFATDRTGDVERLEKASFTIAVMEVATKKIDNKIFFLGADNLNPIFGPGNQSILFLSDRDGYRNMYQYDLTSETLSRLTNYFTGISGITAYSPAISLSPSTNQLVYSYYTNNSYHIYLARMEQFVPLTIAADDVDQSAGILPPQNISKGLVSANLERIDYAAVLSADSIQNKNYRPKFQLDYLGNTGIGIGVGSFGAGLAGGVNMLFSDILGNHQLFSTVALNGEIYDLGGQFVYINQKRRLQWGAGISHIPYRISGLGLSLDTIQLGNQPLEVNNLIIENQRTFEDQLTGFLFYPLSVNRRLEAGASVGLYSFRRDRINNYYDAFGNFIGQDRDKLEAPESFGLQRAYAAFVGDKAAFGLTSPLKGYRYRLEAGRYFGEFGFNTLLADGRKYFFKKPLTLAFRGYFNARLGDDAENNRIPPLFIGFPNLMHGFFGNALNSQQQNGLSFSRLTGSRVMVGNFEARLPFTGPKKLAAIKSNFMLTDLNFFWDAGIAWDSESSPAFKLTSDQADERVPIMSTGLSLRVNLFGYLVVEPYYAIPVLNGNFQKGVFGFNFNPGW